MGKLLDEMIDAATRDKPNRPDGVPVRHRLTEGVKIRPLTTHSDRRGSLFEIFDRRWNWSPSAIDSIYCTSIRPGFVKGWSLHEHHDDRYCLLAGEIDLVLFDPREDSSTYNQICRISLSATNRILVFIPRFVWHADHNVGATDAVLVSLPTEPYDYAAPDKHKLPIDTPLIPYDFGRVTGG